MEEREGRPEAGRAWGSVADVPARHGTSAWAAGGERRIAADLAMPPSVRQRRDLFDALIALGAGVGLAAALRRITEVARDVTGARYAVFVATEAARGSVPAVLRAGVSEHPPPPELADVLRDPAALLGVGDLVRLADLREHPRRSDLPVNLPAGIGLLATPIVAEGDLYGGLVLFSAPSAGFTEQHEDALVTVSAAAGVVIATAALRADVERRQRWLSASADVVATLLGSEVPESVLELVAQRAREVADADLAAILAPASAGGPLVVQVGVGPGASELVGQSVPGFGTHIADVLRTGLPRLLAEQVRQPGRVPQPAELPVLAGPSMLVPFSAAERPLGVLAVGRHPGGPAFGAADLGMASMFAGHAALAVEFTRAQHDREWLAVLEDRDRIARDLHDVVIQRLFVAGLGLQAIGRSAGDPELAARLDGTVDELDQTVTDIRRSIFSLRSPLSGRDGVRARLLAVCTAAAGPLGFEPRVRLDGPLDTVVPDPVGDHLAAVLREALGNAARHAGATAVDVQIRTDGGSVQIEVSDDGAGGAAAGAGGGLADLGRRAAELGGTLQVGPGPVGGTVLTWAVPLARR
jgi:signal transduction histidine kinase